MSEENKRFENEDIQKGLEDFLDHELSMEVPDFPDELPKIDLSFAESFAEENAVPPVVSKPQKALQDPILPKVEPSPKKMQDPIVKPVEKHVEKTVSRPARTRVEYDFYDDDYDLPKRNVPDEDEEYLRELKRQQRKEKQQERAEIRKEKAEERREERKEAKKEAKKKAKAKAKKKAKAEAKKKHKKEKKIAAQKAAEKKAAKKRRKNGEEESTRDVFKKKLKIFGILFAILFVLIFGGLKLMVHKVYVKMNYAEAEQMKKEPYKEDGVINVLLIGNDSRLGGDDGRSDAMILVSISDRTKTITMTSFLRDMYVDIPGHDANRLNAAYAYGGPELLMQTIENNFDIPVHRYALVNFEAFANLVDAVGGIDLDVTNEEVKLINGYLMEYNQLLGRDLTYDWLDDTASGMIHLNGPQALAYSRNRYIGTDFGRTERQRKVLAEVFKKMPMTMLTNSNGVIDGLFPNLTTNLKERECYSISLSAWKVLGYDLVQQCVPIEDSYSNATIRGMAVLEVDLEANKQFLQETLYGK